MVITGSVDVLIVAGQSNAGGVRTTGTGWVTDTSVKIWNGTAFVTYDPATAAGMGDNANNPVFAGGYSAEMEYARQFRLANPGKELRILKYFMGGTLLATTTDPDWNPANGELFSRAGTFFNNALAAIAAEGKSPNIRRLFWMQGESDAVGSITANAYQANLTGWKSAVRSQWGISSTTPITIGRIADTFSWANRDTVRAAQAAVVAADPYLSLLDTDHYSSDGTHYYASGYSQMGFDLWKIDQGTYEGVLPAALARYDASNLGVTNGASVTSISDLRSTETALTVASGTPIYAFPSQIDNGAVSLAGGSLTATMTTMPTQPFTLVVVFKPGATSAATLVTLAGWLFKLTGSAWAMNAGVDLTGGNPDTTWHVAELYFNGASSKLRIDGQTVATGNVGSAAASGSTLLLGSALGTFGELALYAGDTSTTALQTRLQKRWSSPIPAAPSFTAGASISGGAIQGQTLTANATVAGSPNPSLTYQWYWADTNAPISGATASTYTIQAGDVGHTIKVTITATNAVSPPATSTSSATGAVQAGASLSLNFVTASYTGATPANTNASGGFAETTGGVLTSFAANALRRTDKGLLVEPSRTNLLSQSQDVSSAPWTHPATANTSTTLPDGNTGNASRLTMPVGSNNARAFQGALGGNTTKTFTFFFKASATVPYIHIRITQSGSWGACIDTNTNAVTTGYSDGTGASPALTSCTVTTMANGWKKAVAVAPATGACYAFVYFSSSATNTVVTWAGTETIDMTFFDFKDGSIPTSYVPTTTAQATYAADAVGFTVPSGIGTLTYTFDDNSTQNVSVSPGAYTIPTNLNRPYIKTVVGS